MYKGGISRGYEIREIYYIILKRSLKEGHSMKEASAIAYDAIELIYGLSRKRAYAVMNDPAVLSNKNPNYSLAFSEKLSKLVAIMKILEYEKS